MTDYPQQRAPRWPYVAVGVLMALLILAVVAWSVSLPYVAWSPGPVPEVVSLITVEGAQTYPVRGNLYMLTVSQQDINAYELLAAWADPTVDVLDRTAVRPVGQSPEEYQRVAQRDMLESKNTAILVALDRLGYDVTYTGDGVEVATILKGTPADGALELGDVITAINGKPVELARDAVALITAHAIGDTITLTVERGDQTIDVPITLVEHTQEKGRPMVGFGAVTHNLTYDFPIQVDIDSTNIGGPSAGMMYTLAVIDVLTPDDITKGHRIAGTGTIASDGSVGPIGGIRQKVEGAEAAGAEYILVPKANYEEALTAHVTGVQIIPVQTIDDALEFLSSLPNA
ncbi:lon protease [bacterium BMS3Abin02]|nr:lon protease [bacterium BMS3Abin02]